MALRSTSIGAAVRITALMALVGGASSWPARASETTLVLDEPRAEFDRAAYLDEVVEHRFAFRNEGATDVIVVEVVDVSGSAEIEISPTTIAAGASGEIVVRQPMERLGEFNHRYAILTDESGRPRYRFTLSGFAQSAYDPEVIRVDLGWIDRAQGGEQRIELSSREVARLEVLGTDGLPDWLALREVERLGVAGEGMALTLTMAPNAPLGMQGGEAQIRTNVGHQQTQRVAWSANVFGDIVPSENPIEFGLGREGGRVETAIRLESRTGTAFEVDRIDDLPTQLTASYRPCGGEDPTPSPCWHLELVASSAGRDNLSGVFQVRLVGQSEPLPLRFRAIFVGRDTMIQQLEVPGSGAQP